MLRARQADVVERDDNAEDAVADIDERDDDDAASDIDERDDESDSE